MNSEKIDASGLNGIDEVEGLTAVILLDSKQVKHRHYETRSRRVRRVHTNRKSL